MEIYIIIALSFAIMFTYRYTRDIVFMVRNVAIVHELEENRFLLNALYVSFFLLAALLMPAYAILVFQDRKALIKNWSKSILVQHYGLEVK